MSTVSVNTHFPGYEILGELGRSNARVLKARHLDTGDLVAIKHFTLGTDADTLRRFQQESEIMTGIRHPNVVQVREVQLDRSFPFIVMEWVEGGDLRSLITRQGPLNVSTVIRLGQQVAGAFRAIHPREIVHRDIKPENILYRPLPSGELHFLLTDFGVARLREQSHTITGQSLMTYEYASPEQFDNPKGVTVATDYYSLGVVLYECLTGQVPFSLAGSGMAAFMNQVLYTPAPQPVLLPDQNLPPSLETLVLSMLIKNPEERLSDVAELTLLLSQASVEQLQLNRSGPQVGWISSRSPTLPIPIPASETFSEPVPAAESGGHSGGWGILVGLLAVGLMVGGVIYYKSQQRTSVTDFTPDSTAVMPDSSVTEDVSADTSSLPVESFPAETTADSAITSPTSTSVETTPIAHPPIAIPDTTVVKDTSSENGPN